MSSAELQSLMSQLQVQRQDPYSQSNLHSQYDSNLHPENVGFKWTYMDGTEGDDGLEPIEGKAAARQRKISTWVQNTAIDRTGKRFFKEFKLAEPGPNGSIDYAKVDKEDMALTIAWEKMWRGRAEKERNELRKELHTMKSGNISNKDARNGNTGAFTIKTGTDGAITVTPAGHATGKTGAHKKKKNHGSEEKQRKRYDKNIDRLTKIYADQGKPFEPKPFKLK